MKQSLYKSLALHFVVFLLIMVDIPLFWHNKTTLNQVPIIVDLNNVKISEMTNLPPKAKMGKEDKAASKVKRKIENNYTKEEPKKDDKRPTARAGGRSGSGRGCADRAEERLSGCAAAQETESAEEKADAAGSRGQAETQAQT